MRNPKSVNKEYIVRCAAQKTDFIKANVSEVYDAIFEAMADAIDDDNDVIIPKFGRIEVSLKPARIVVNPKTQLKQWGKARKVLKFRPLGKLSDLVKGYEGDGIL